MASIYSNPKPDSIDVLFTENQMLPEFVNFDQKLNCSSCKTLLSSPVQLPCGHRICKDCYKILIDSDKVELECPSKEDDCDKFSSDKIFPDYSAIREIRQLAVFCTYKSYGCEETMPWCKLKSHTEQCKFSKKICCYCKEELAVELFQNHIENECEEVTRACPFNCGDVKELKRFQLELHKRNCRLKPKDCKYKNIGCIFQATEEKIAEHENDYQYHLEMAVEHTVMLNEEMGHLKESLKIAEDGLDSLRVTVGELMKEKYHIVERLKDIDNEFKLEKDRQKELLLDHSARLDSTTKAVDKVVQDFQVIRIKQNQQDTKIAEVENSTRHRRSSLSLPEDMRQQFISHDRTIALHEVRLAELDLRFQCLQTANYEGVLIWKIADYQKRKKYRLDGNIMSLYSQPFYTSRYGYKMCGRVYLNGDGIGKGTHLSLFFVVMQGDYDDILSWPFKQKVTLTLIDQKNNRRHLSDTFRPDPSSNSFQKPKSPMNVASGCPLFVKHSVLEDREEVYLRNNTIYIKITVDTSDLLNP